MAKRPVVESNLFCDLGLSREGDPLTEANLQRHHDINQILRNSTTMASEKQGPFVKHQRKFENGENVQPSAVRSGNMSGHSKQRSVALAPVFVPNAVAHGMAVYDPHDPRTGFTTGIDADGKTNSVTHYLKLSNMNATEFGDKLTKLCDKFKWTEAICTGKSARNQDGFMDYYVEFKDLRDADAGYKKVTNYDPDWSIEFTAREEYESAGGKLFNRDVHAGQVIIFARFQETKNPSLCKNEEAAAAVLAWATDFGEVYSMAEDTDHGAQFPCVAYRLEFFAMDAAKQCIENSELEGWSSNDVFSVRAGYVGSTLPPDLPDPPRHGSGYDGQTDSPPFASNEAYVLPVSPGVDIHESPTGRSAWYVDRAGRKIPMKPRVSLPKITNFPMGVPMTSENVRHFTTPEGHQTSPVHLTYTNQRHDSGTAVVRSTPAGRMSRSSANNAQQVVELKFVEAGLDTRTTIMLRNIPNGWNIWKLKEAIDKYARGKYDFMYLRIDFTKATNVGYGFINFTTPEDIINVHLAYDDKPWTGVTGDRKGGLSYATIQGIDCLIEKFRNSAVMDESPDYRPKLFFHDNHPLCIEDEALIGDEMPFPPPNNNSKKERSRCNAHEIGLFDVRDKPFRGQRGRESTYDKGNPAQIQEARQYGSAQVGDYLNNSNYAMPNQGHLPYGQMQPANQYYGYNQQYDPNGMFVGHGFNGPNFAAGPHMGAPGGMWQGPNGTNWMQVPPGYGPQMPNGYQQAYPNTQYHNAPYPGNYGHPSGRQSFGMAGSGHYSNYSASAVQPQGYTFPSGQASQMPRVMDEPAVSPRGSVVPHHGYPAVSPASHLEQGGPSNTSSSRR